MGKLYDLAVVTGEYQDNQGQQKRRYQNVGAVMQGKDGGQYLLLEKWFNPAGVPGNDDRSSVLISCFEPRQQSHQGQQPQPQPQGGYQQPQGGYQQPQGGYQQPQGGYQQPQQQQMPQSQQQQSVRSPGGHSGGANQFDEDIPF